MSQPDRTLDEFDSDPAPGRRNRLDDNVYDLPTLTATEPASHTPTGDVVSRFEFRPVTPDTVAVIESVRAAVIDLARALDELLPDCREKTLAIIQLEQAHFWADAAIARNS
jgi:hypothetical protein